MKPLFNIDDVIEFVAYDTGPKVKYEIIAITSKNYVVKSLNKDTLDEELLIEIEWINNNSWYEE